MLQDQRKRGNPDVTTDTDQSVQDDDIKDADKKPAASVSWESFNFLFTMAIISKTIIHPVFEIETWVTKIYDPFFFITRQENCEISFGVLGDLT